jgi:hypothetical protein
MRHWSLVWHLGVVLCWHDCALDGPVKANNCEAVVGEFQMAAEAAVRFWKAPQDSCIVEFGMP